MRTCLKIILSGTLLTALLTAPKVHAQAHEHINAGAASLSQGSLLLFDGAEDFLASSGYVWETEWQPGGYFPGYYAVDNLSFTALPATIFYGGPEGMHAAIGTNLKLQITSVEGPAGGSFGYWEGYSKSTVPTAVFEVGSFVPVQSVDNPLSAFSDGYWTINLTEAFPQDPYGHIHDRGYSFTLPGTYEIGFRIIDTTGWHETSDVYTFAFSVVPEPSTIALLSAGAVIAIGVLARRARQRA
jgi:hypothetical protein